MRPEDFFTEPEPDPLDEFGITSKPKFNLNLVRKLRSGPLAQADDVEAAVALARLVHDDLEAFGTEGGRGANRSPNEGIAPRSPKRS